MTVTAASHRGSPRQRAVQRIQGRSERASLSLFFLLRSLLPFRPPRFFLALVIAGIPKNNFHMRASERTNEGSSVTTLTKRVHCVSTKQRLEDPIVVIDVVAPAIAKILDFSQEILQMCLVFLLYMNHYLKERKKG